MRAALLAAVLVATAGVAAADPPELRFGLAGGTGSIRRASFDAPSGTAVAARVAAGWWVSPEVTFGVHLGYAAFEDSFDDPANTPHHAEYRYSAIQLHATFLYHWKHLVAGGGIGFDRANEILLVTDGMTRDQSSPSKAIGVHAELGVDIVRLGPVQLGAFAMASAEPVPLDNNQVLHLATATAGLSVTVIP